MNVLVLCVVIEIVTAALYIGQSQYPNDENQMRRFKISHYLPPIPSTRKYHQNRLNDGSGIRILYPQSNTFRYVSRPIVPYLMERVNNIYKTEELRRIPYIIWRFINRLNFTKTPKIHTDPKIILYRLLLKEFIYKFRHENVNINDIRKLIIKLLQRKEYYIFLNINKTHETDLSKLTPHKTKDSGPYQEAIANSTGLPFKNKLTVLGKKIKNEQIQNLAESKHENNIEVPDKNNQDGRKFFIKNLHFNIGGNVSNIAHKSIKKTKEGKAITKETLMKSSSKMNNSHNNSITIYNKGNLLVGENDSLNKNNDNQKLKSLSSQSDNSTFSAKNNTIVNFKEQNKINNSNQKSLDKVLQKDGYNIDSKDDVLRKNPTFLIRAPEPDNNINYNIKNALGYHNLHQISQGTGDLEKNAYNNERTRIKPAVENFSNKIQNEEYQIVKPKVENDTRHVENSLITSKQDIRGTIAENLLDKHTSTIEQNKTKKYDEPPEFEVEHLSKSRLPCYLPEIIRTGKSNNKAIESSFSAMVKGSDQKNVHTTKNRGDEESVEVENIKEKNLHKITNEQGTRANLLIDSMKPIEITKTHRVIVKETKTITFGDQSELDKKKDFTDNNKKTNQENTYELFFLNDNDSPPPVKKVIVTDNDTSDKIKSDNNIGKSNLLHDILNNLSLTDNKIHTNNNDNNKRYFNKHINFFKSVKHQSDLLQRKQPNWVFEKDYGQYKDAKRYETKNHLCNCKQTDSTQKINKYDDLLKKVPFIVHSTTFNKNQKMEGKNIHGKSQLCDQTTSETYKRAPAGDRDIKWKSIHLVKKRADIEEQDNIQETSNVMTNKDKVISNILAPEDVKSDKKLLPYWLPSDAQDVYEILQLPPKDGAVSDSLDLEMPLKEEIDKIVQLRKELGNENLEEIINLKVNTVGIGKATNIIDKLIPSLYDVYLKNFITKILYRLRQKLSNYELTQQNNEIKNLDIHEIRKANSVLDIFESIRDVFNKEDDESLYGLLVSLLRFNKQSDEDFDEEVKVILDSVNRKSIYGVLRHFLVPEPTLNAVREYLKQQELYPQFVYYKVLEDILPNLRIIIINALAIEADKHDDVQKNEETMEKLVKILIILYKVMKDLGIPETTQRFIIEESVLDIVKNLANAYIKNYEETVYVQIKKQLQDALYNNINV